MTGAQFEIRIDGTPSGYDDTNGATRPPDADGTSLISGGLVGGNPGADWDLIA